MKFLNFTQPFISKILSKNYLNENCLILLNFSPRLFSPTNNCGQFYIANEISLSEEMLEW